MRNVRTVRSSLLTRVLLFLSAFIFTIVLQSFLQGYQSRLVVEPLGRSVGTLQSISQFLNHSHEIDALYEEFRWEYGDIEEFLQQMKDRKAAAETDLARIPFEIPSEGREEYLLKNAVVAANGALDGADDELVALLEAGKRVEASRVYYEVVRPYLSYLLKYAQQLLEASITQNHDTYTAIVELNAVITRFQTASLILTLVTGTILVVSIVHLLGAIRKLSFQSVAIERGNLDLPDLPVRHHDEIGEMAKAFNNMKRSMKKQVEILEDRNEMERELFLKTNETLELQNIIEREKLQQLRSQINPHFLFNTLNVIKIAAIDEQAVRTEKMLASLGRIYHYAMSRDAQLVPVSQEIRIVEALFSLYKARFEDKIEMIWKSDPQIDLTETYIPPFVIQPIVENAIKHGILPKEEEGTVLIDIGTQGELLTISVEDDGVGMDAGTLDAIRRTISERNAFADHIGIYNVAARLRILSRNSSFSLDSSPGIGTKVSMTLPIEKPREEEEGW